MSKIKTVTVYIGAGDQEYKTEAEAWESLQCKKLADALEKAIAGDNTIPHDVVGYDTRYKLRQNISFVTYHRKAILRVFREIGEA